MAVVIALVVLVMIPFAAASGKGYRGAYLGFSVVALIGVVFFSFWGTATAPADADARLIESMAMMRRTGPGLMLVCGGLLLGCLMGAAFWRPKAAGSGGRSGPVVALRCVKCGHRNPVGPANCESCGAALKGTGSQALSA